MCDEHFELEDYQSGVPRWCTGCGDNAILAAVQRLCRDEGLRPEKTVFVSGIGCSSRFPHYMKTYGFHGIHGRALPVAEGVKMARPDLTVFVNTGDGDCTSIGAAHWIHAIRYNMNLTVFLHDNQIYGLTKKQASPTSPNGTKSNTTPRGSYLEALNPLTVTLGVQNVSFVAQAVDWIPEVLYDILSAAYHHKGFSFVRIIQRCPEWLPKAFEPFLQDPQRTLLLHGEGGLSISPALSKVYKNQEQHDPSNIEPGARDRLRARPDSGRHSLPQSRGPLLRGPAQRRTVARAQFRQDGARGRVRQVHRLAAAAGKAGRARLTQCVGAPVRQTQGNASMQAELQAHLAFHLTGQTQAGQLDTIDGLLPAQFANYRELGKLRYDFPLVLLGNATDDGFVLSLSGLIDGILHDVAQGADGERLRQHAFRLEREIRALVAEGTSGTLSALWEAAAGRLAGHNDELLQDSLRRLRAALKLDGDVVDCDKSMPFRLLQHGWKVLREHKARKIGKTIDELIIKLSDILAAEFVNSDEGLSPEQLKEGIGSSQRDAFDFSAMSRLLLECSPRTPLPETRRRRIQGLLSVLKAQRFFPASKQRDRSSRSGSPHDFVFDGSAEAVQAYRARLPEMTELAKALAVAELEVEGRYHAATHDPLFARYGANGLDAEDLELFPDYLIRVRPDKIVRAEGGRARPAGKGPGAERRPPGAGDARRRASWRWRREPSSSPPWPSGWAASFRPAIERISARRLARAGDRAGSLFAGPAIFNIFSGANAEAGALPAYLSGGGGRQVAGHFPAFVYNPSAGADLAARFQLHANQPDLDWPVQRELAYEERSAPAHPREPSPFTLVDFVACDPRCAKHFARFRAQSGTPVCRRCPNSSSREPKDLADKVPCLLMVDRDNACKR